MPTNQKDRSDLINTVALLVLDAQDCFIDTLHDKPGFLSRCTFAIDAAQALGITTLFTEQVPNKLGHTNAKLLRRAQSPKLFHKESFSALSAPGIESFLRDNEIYHLLVCGLETPICVYQTGLQAVDEDIDVTFLVDALGCRRAEDAPHVIEALRGLGCQVLPTETIFYSLIGDVTHPGFRSLNELVKTFSQEGFNIEAYLDKAPKPIASSQQEEQPNENNPKEDRPQRRRSRNPRRGRRNERTENSERPERSERPELPTSPKNSPANAPATEKTESKNVPSQSRQTEKQSKQPVEKERRPRKPRVAAVKTSDEKTPAVKKVAKKIAKKRAPRKIAKKAARKIAPAKDSS